MTFYHSITTDYVILLGSLKKKILVPIQSQYSSCATVLRAGYHVLCRYRWVLADKANDNNGRVDRTYPTHSWNVVNSNVTSSLALISNDQD